MKPILWTLAYSLLCFFLAFLDNPDALYVNRLAFLEVPCIIIVGVFVILVVRKFSINFFADSFDLRTAFNINAKDADGRPLWYSYLLQSCILACLWLGLIVLILSIFSSYLALLCLSVPIAAFAYFGSEYFEFNARKKWGLYVVAVIVGLLCNQCTRSCSSSLEPREGYFNEWTGKPNNPFPMGVPGGY